MSKIIFKVAKNKLIGSPSMNFINGKITNTGNFSNESGELEFELLKERSSFIQNYKDKSIGMIHWRK